MLSSFTIWTVNADAVQYCVDADRIAASKKLFRYHLPVIWHEKSVTGQLRTTVRRNCEAMRA
jgi:hypothetical protein